MASLPIHLRQGTQAFARHKAQARSNAAAWALRTLSISPNRWCILDTETSGLGEDAEVIQVGLIDGAGKVLIDNTLCRPAMPIPSDATAIHHITNEMVKDAPGFCEVYRELARLTDTRVVVIYNKAYDLRLIRQSIARCSAFPPFTPARIECAMLQYAEYVGDWNAYHQNFKWPKLEGGDHSALGDCLATLEVIRRMARDG